MTNDPKPTPKSDEAEAQSNQSPQEHKAPPSYTPESPRPPTYSSVSAAVRSDIHSLSIGDLQETISVPMIMRREANSVHNYNPFSRKSGSVTHSVIVRKMTRDHYLKHYVKDAEGRFVGTGKPAPDAALVFAPGKSAPEDLMRQVGEVVFGKQALRGKGLGKFGMPLE